MNKYYKVFLVLKPWTKKDGTKGEDYCFTNRIPRANGSIAGHEYSISFLRGDNNPTSKTAEPAIFAWMSKMNLEMYEAYVEEHSDVAWACEEDNSIITNAEYLELFPQEQTEQPQQSASAF